MPLFSRRNEPKKDVFSYAISDIVRRRIFFCLRDHLESLHGNQSIDSVLEEVESKIQRAYGGFRLPAYRASWVSDNPVIQHFFTCSDEEVMDFLQMCFDTTWHLGGQPAVELINSVLSEENIGFELTDYSEIYSDEPATLNGVRISGRAYRSILPKAVRKDEKILHSDTVKPCLNSLADPRFSIASKELLAAFEEHGKGNYGDAITDAGAAFESVLKVICSIKKWTYDKDKDTCAKLLEICQAKGLFHPFYRTVLEPTATVRNKLGDAHGKGPAEHFPPNKDYADHMLYMVCNNINLVISLAKL